MRLTSHLRSNPTNVGCETSERVCRFVVFHLPLLLVDSRSHLALVRNRTLLGGTRQQTCFDCFRQVVATARECLICEGKRLAA